jgi:predicted dehydrogenase
MFAKPLAQEWTAHAALVGLFDKNPKRAKLLADECGGVAVYPSFDAMIEKAKPDTVIVATTDGTHHDYIIRSLQAGCDVITEKPMTINAEHCAAILEAERATGKKVTVTFNARYSPYNEAIKQMMVNGDIGRPLHIQFDYMLDRSHGADYFRRWHRDMTQSGGLLIHKATHVFDLFNWWLDDYPAKVSASGGLRFYGPNRSQRGDRCLTCSYQHTCEFYLDIAKNHFTRTYYLESEQEDGYIRDGCVFDESISIYDSMSASIEYTKGSLLSFSLQAFSPYEGWRLSIQGTEGKLEAEHIKSGQHIHDPHRYIRIHGNNGSVVTHSLKRIDEGHGGGDARLRRYLFGPAMEDPLEQQADSYAGAMSLLLGAAANQSIQDKREVTIQSLMPQNVEVK